MENIAYTLPDMANRTYTAPDMENLISTATDMENLTYTLPEMANITYAKPDRTNLTYTAPETGNHVCIHCRVITSFMKPLFPTFYQYINLENCDKVHYISELDQLSFVNNNYIFKVSV